MGYENNNIIESLHEEFCKYIMKVKKCAPNCIVYGELGRVPMPDSVKARMIGFWERILTGKRERKCLEHFMILYISLMLLMFFIPMVELC
jgi:hypothetical protein